ncbi:hypothetical protein F4212_03265 [Candidatus Poribacteria bacterium]|nr:hypothetical protein [Gammaproteobacteria bacterium]MYF98143.1 hypothetical protein [Candidatus Poribacteria bacterium]
MEILFIAPFALLLGILEEAREMTEEQFPDDIVPSRIRHVHASGTGMFMRLVSTVISQSGGIPSLPAPVRLSFVGMRRSCFSETFLII